MTSVPCIRTCARSLHLPGGLVEFAHCCRSVKHVGFGRVGRLRGGSYVERGKGGIVREVRALSSSDDSMRDANGGQTKPDRVPGWADPSSEELPPWAVNERPKSQEPVQDLPFFVYLIGSSLVAIAAVGSIFEYFNKNAIFGVVQTDSPLWAPILGFFAFTGLPSAGFLFYKSISLANKASEDIDREDGFLGR